MEANDKLDYLNLKKIGVIRSTLTNKKDCPLQGDEGAPEAWLHIEKEFKEGLDGLTVGSSIILLTWLHLSNRDILKCYPRDNHNARPVGVFTTRSPDRPNPIGLHTVKIIDIEGNKIKVYPLEAIAGTVLLDIKPVLTAVNER
jgi:tRNA-Thr(GGU) m(6)t(6)A37 methyltransferase TsaA